MLRARRACPAGIDTANSTGMAGSPPPAGFGNCLKWRSNVTTLVWVPPQTCFETRDVTSLDLFMSHKYKPESAEKQSRSDGGELSAGKSREKKIIPFLPTRRNIITGGYRTLLFRLSGGFRTCRLFKTIFSSALTCPVSHDQFSQHSMASVKTKLCRTVCSS